MAGLLIFAAGLVLAPTVTTTTGYPRLGVAMVLLEAGLVLSSAPPFRWPAGVTAPQTSPTSESDERRRGREPAAVNQDRTD